MVVNNDPVGLSENEIGLIPQDWRVCTFGEVCDLSNAKADPKVLEDIRYVGLEHIDTSSPILSRWGSSDDVRSAKNCFREGDILYGKLRPYLRKAAIAGFTGICSTDVLVLKAKAQVSSDWLVFLLHTDDFIGHAISTTAGTNLPRTSWTAIKQFRLPLPPPPEQRRIAHILGTIQRAIQAQDAVISAARELKRSLMHRLFTYGPYAEPMPTKETEIGEVPESWEMTTLGRVAAIERGKFSHRPRNAPEFYGGAIPFIQTGDVAQSSGRIKTFTQTLNAKGLSVSRMFPKGTIVITIAANIGYTGILEFDSAFPDSLIGITPHETVMTSFLEQFLRTQQARMDALAPRGTQKNINM